MFYAYVRTGYFNAYCSIVDPLNTRTTPDLLSTFLRDIGTPCLTTKQYKSDMFYAYVPIQPGQCVRYRLTQP